MYSLEGQIAIITGGARGIGKGICEVFCKAGATVALWDVLDEGNHTADQIKKEGGSIFFQKVDITNKSSVEEAVSKIISVHGKIDIPIKQLFEIDVQNIASYFDLDGGVTFCTETD